MAHKLKNLVIKAVALCDEGACSAAHIKLVKTKPKEVSVMEFEELIKTLPEDQQKVIRDELAKKADEVSTKTAEELTKAKGDLVVVTAKVASLENDLAKAKTQPTNGTSDEDLLKNVDPAVKALIEKAQNQAVAAQAAILKMKEDAEEAECLAKAKTLADTGVPEDELKNVLKSAKKVDGEFASKLYTMLESMCKTIQGSAAFQATGSDSEGVMKGKGEQATAAIEAEINKVAVNIAKTSGCTKEQAFAKALQENPELYSRYLATLEQ